jgi:uncharacterized protein DUF6627
MKSFYKLICRLLIVSMLWLPFAGQAAMISTGDVVAAATDQLNRDKVLEFAARADVQKSFESLGLNASTARDRVKAMTQEEVNRIAGKIDSMPAGASDGWWWALGVIVVGLIVWYAYK